MVVGAIAIGIAYWYDSQHSSKSPQLADTLLAQGIDISDVTDEQKQSYSVDGPTKPKSLTISSIGVNNLRVQEVGYVTGSTQIDVPKNINDVGWFNCSLTNGRSDLPSCEEPTTPSANSSEDLAVVIDGHMCHGLTCAFNNLSAVKPGDIIDLTTGDGNHYSYSIDEVEILDVDKVDMHKATHTHTEGERGLNLISCLGSPTKVDQLGRSTYDKRVIVYSTLTES